MSEKRKRSPEESQSSAVFRSAPIEDRASKFVGYFSPALKHKDLQGLDEIRSADHKILSWRRESNQQSITGGTRYTTDHDDDGEKYAGKRVAKVLDSMQVVGACVVARWYGGVLLGPVRFDHIEECAKEAVQKWKDSVVAEQSKKRKVEEDAILHKKLVAVLTERDQSVAVLRSLAQEKEEKLKKAMAKGGDKDAEPTKTVVSSSQQSTTDGKPAMDYGSMTLDRLKALEKARDATLAFLLKRIDKAELELVGATGEIPKS